MSTLIIFLNFRYAVDLKSFALKLLAYDCLVKRALFYIFAVALHSSKIKKKEISS